MLITLNNVTFSYTGEKIFSDVSLSIDEGERVGFIGGNGEGKTTLIKLILGELNPEQGTVVKKNGIRLGYLPQSGGFEHANSVRLAMEEVFERDKFLLSELQSVQEKMATNENLPSLMRKAEALEREITSRDSYHYGVKIQTVLNGMGFMGRSEEKVATMSGGEKTKLKLCRLLLEEPDLLILDEPTNHLDLSTLFWLEDYLASFKGALFVVSHDRYFLDKLTSRTLELENGKLSSYKGNYSKYKVLKEERYKTELREYEKQLEKSKKLQEYIDKNLVRATTAKSAQSRVKQLDKITLEKPIPPKEPPRFRFTYETQPYERVLFAPRFDLYAGDKQLLTNAEFTLMRGEKCALVGDNGTGKSTLLKFLLSGDKLVSVGKFVKCAYYDQENAALDSEAAVIDDLRFRFPLFPLTEAYSLLAQSGIDSDDALKKVKELSGGLKAKLALAILQAQKGNFLALDEPTNHLDLLSREALESALKEFDGTLLFVSHDRRFIESIATSVICIENGTLTKFNGSYPAFLESRKAKPAEEKPAPAPAKKAENDSYRSKEERARQAKLRTRISEIEARLPKIEEEQEALNAELIANAADYAKVKEITQKLNALQEESDKLYEEYGTLI
ncbi:MAG: ABC-F family ATP-binding cassette domain-containing protein [Clostridia bacterium]|nr:ABC-F family ATP-binding cassette domain-containing protein [Clostridia bacterium]